MNKPGSKSSFFESSDGLRLFFRTYGESTASTPVICLPGLTRNSRDFDLLATRISRQRQVITTDLRGRGRSDYDPDRSNYHPAQYVADIWQLLGHLGLENVVIIGTSLGGLMAMIMAYERPAAVAGVVLNDIGPELDPTGLARIMESAGTLPPVASIDEAVEQTKKYYSHVFPDWPDERWLDYALTTYRDVGDGSLDVNLDRNVGIASREGISGLRQDPWILFDALSPIPLLVLRGGHSDLFSTSTLDKMKNRNPDMIAVEISNRGHAPFLDEPEAVDAIDQFLKSF